MKTRPQAGPRAFFSPWPSALRRCPSISSDRRSCASRSRSRWTTPRYTPADTRVVVEEGQEAVMNFQLKAQAIELEAIVSVGYGEKRREDLTGAVTTVGPEALSGRPVTNTVAALQGALPGLIVQRGGGQPGVEDFNLNLRGVSSY